MVDGQRFSLELLCDVENSDIPVTLLVEGQVQVRTIVSMIIFEANWPDIGDLLRGDVSAYLRESVNSVGVVKSTCILYAAQLEY